jgi:hypothetical protein
VALVEAAWARELVDLYESNAATQFIIYGNVNDRMLVDAPGCARIGSLTEYLLEVLLPRFDVVLSYDLGNGLRIEKGGPVFSTWPYFKENPVLPKAPRLAVEVLTQYFRYCANLGRLGREPAQVGCFLRGANLIAPASQGVADYDLGAMITLMRDWASDNLISSLSIATFLITENLNDLHPLLVNNNRAAKIKVPLPDASQLSRACAIIAPAYPTALAEYQDQPSAIAQQLAGATLGSVESLFKSRQHAGEKLLRRAGFQRPDRIHGVTPHARPPLRPGQSEDLVATGHSVMACRRHGRTPERLFDLWPRGHWQDFHGRVPGRRSWRPGREAQELPRQMGRQHRRQPRKDLPPVASAQPLLRIHR